jgi:hypothetical protein
MTSNSGKLGLSVLLSLMLTAAVAGPKDSQPDVTIETVQVTLVDFDDVKAMKLGPLTDYISMVGLAQVDLDGDWGDVPTILRLFSNSADVAAQRMSAWDRSFLRALYSTPQQSRFQRSEMARSMVRDFVKE